MASSIRVRWLHGMVTKPPAKDGGPRNFADAGRVIDHHHVTVARQLLVLHRLGHAGRP
ncbi:MAG TPA: hypothetical protein VHE81_09695 [Lacipirellulaceae bacterium]|nr:hypothetical protein [Lacipirellulaceae bacterium]